MNESELLIEFAKGWNNLDVSFMEDILDENLEYTSQWVIETMHGKNNYLNYIEGKFKTIRNSINIPQAELGYYKNIFSEENKPCLVIAQGDNKVVVLANVKDGKLSKINMVGIPLPNNAILFDFKPK